MSTTTWSPGPSGATILPNRAPWPLLPTRDWESADRSVKRALDVVLGLVCLLLVLPVIGVAALLIKLTSPGPAFFLQTRKGRGEESFDVIKLRTMVPGADAMQHAVAANSAGPLFITIHDDPRVTRVGAILRRWSIDELPQLVNVIRGEMSLVGPRPLMDEEVGRLPPGHRWARARVKPGMTGLWQVSGRNSCPDETRLELDQRYLDDWSLGLDLRIILLTVPAVLTGRGAG